MQSPTSSTADMVARIYTHGSGTIPTLLLVYSRDPLLSGGRKQGPSLNEIV